MPVSLRFRGVVSLVLLLAVAGAAFAQEATPEADYVYRVGSDDVLYVEVYDEPDLTGDVTVASDGTIVIGLIGRVEVAGLTADEIQKLVTRLLEQDYLYDPEVDVTIRSHRSQKVKLLGSVIQPGIYNLDGAVRLFDLLSRAGGTSERLGEVRKGQMVRVVRPSGNGAEPEKVFIDLHDLLVIGKEDANILLRSGDVIYVPEKEWVHVIGEVKIPGSFAFEEGMNVLMAITLAGGPTKKASLKNTVVKRVVGERQIERKVIESDLLKPDDIIEVPLSFW